ncbi:MAG: NUDIX hydrolase [Chitinophagaceae bacterium]|nr:NUDIX hydrolase [Chitinophagaceae bacterium]
MDIVKYKSNDRILLAVDCIIFGFDGQQLKLLLIKRDFEPQKGKWSLVGGFVSKNESVDDAAIRVLNKLTGFTDIYMEQLHCFGEVDRDTAGRVVSIAYYSLINIANYTEQLADDHEAKWFEVESRPPLIFDHQLMVEKALGHLREKITTHPIGFELLPAKFTLPQLQSLYEAIYGYPIDKRNFSKKILSLGILKKMKDKDMHSSKRGAYYYTISKTKNILLPSRLNL